MAGKFYVRTVSKYTSSYDTFAEAELAAKKRRIYQDDDSDSSLVILQGVATIDMPVTPAITTML